MQPLKGITVVTLAHAIAAPFATRQLADMGARVIKIERPGVGDFARGYDERVPGLASHFVWTNRSKESLTLDVKHAEAQKILMRLIVEEADVQGQRIDVSMLELLTEWMSYPLTIYPYGPFPAGDGKTVMLGLQNERQWKIFCDKVLDNPGLAWDPRFSTTAKRRAQRIAALRAEGVV